MAKGWLIGGGIFLGVLLIASIALALTQREETPFPVGTPEAAVQDFLKASETEDFQVAYDLLSERLKSQCELQDFVGQRFPGDRTFENSRVTLERTSAVNDTTFVTVRITQIYNNGPFGSSESSHEHRYALVQEDGQWRFSDYPWPFFNCGRFNPEPARPVVPTPAPTSEPEASPTPAAP